MLVRSSPMGGVVKQWIDHGALAEQTGIVIPAFFSSKPDDDTVRQLLWMTLADTPHLYPPEQTLVVVDGDARTSRLATEARERMQREQGGTFGLLDLPQNRGKFGAISAGITALMDARPGIQFFAVRDGDGDHALTELPALVRMALDLAEALGHMRVITVGARRSRIHPMGWTRGEIEWLLDAVTLDALRYRLACEGRVVNLAHNLTPGQVPDISSGFKVYGREIAAALFAEGEPKLGTLSAEDYWHFGPETVTYIEASLRGAVMAEKLRLTWDGQPATSFGEFEQVRLYGELLAWVWVRLDIPLSVAAQMIDNWLPTMALRTTVAGRELVNEVREHALRRVRDHRGLEVALPEPAPTPTFV